jgi:hypothetical protein
MYHQSITHKTETCLGQLGINPRSAAISFYDARLMLGVGL